GPVADPRVPEGRWPSCFLTAPPRTCPMPARGSDRRAKRSHAMRQILSPDGRRAVNAVIAFLAIATFLYLFVYPALVATGVIELDAATFAIGVALTMLFWLVIANGAYSAAAEIYHFRRKSLLPDTLVLRRLFERYGHRSTDRLHAPVVIGL